MSQVIASHDNFDLMSLNYGQGDKKSIVEGYLKRRLESEAAE